MFKKGTAAINICLFVKKGELFKKENQSKLDQQNL